METAGDIIEIKSELLNCSFLTIEGLTSRDEAVRAQTYRNPKYEDAADFSRLKKGMEVFIETGRGRVKGVLCTGERVIVPETSMMKAALGIDFPHTGSFWPVDIDNKTWFVSSYLIHSAAAKTFMSETPREELSEAVKTEISRGVIEVGNATRDLLRQFASGEITRADAELKISEVAGKVGSALNGIDIALPRTL